MMKKIALFLTLGCGAVFAQDWPAAGTVEEVLRRANGYWIANNGPGNSGWARAAYYTGNQRAFRVLGERDYHDWAVAWGNANLWKIGPEGPTHADAHCCGQTYIDLYRLDPQPVYLADIKTRMDAVVANTRVDYWWWIDAFYMAGPTLARLGSLTGDTNYFDKLWLMYDDTMTRRGLYDASESLWYRDANYFYPAAQTANGQKVFWSRGNGWVFAGLARVIDEMPPGTAHRDDFITMFQTMAAKLKTLQGADGMWRSSLADPLEYPNPETSGTGFFTYGMAWGVRHNLLPAAEYTNTILQAWTGLTNLALQPSGRVGWVQNVGAAPAATTENFTTDFGVGAFLLACSEIYLLAPDSPALRPWAGPDQTLTDTDTNGVEFVTLDATGTELYRGTAGPFVWWEGGTPLATGVTAQVSLPLGQHVITLNVPGSDGSNYTDTVTKTIIAPPVIPEPQLKLHFAFEDAGTTTTDFVAGVSLNLVNAAGAAVDLHGAPGTGVAGRGRALDFTSAASQGGTGPMAFTSGNSTINFGMLTSFTATIWVKPAANLVLSGFPRFFTLGTNGITDRGVANSLGLLSNGNLQPTTAVQGFVNTLQSSTSGFGAFDMPAGQWRFLALAYDGVSLRCYGGSESNTVALVSEAGFPAGPINLGNSWTVFVGNRNARDRAFLGELDEVRFYAGAAGTNVLEQIRQQAVTLPPPVLTPTIQGTNLILKMDTVPGASYVIESTPALSPVPAWIPMATNAGTGAVLTYPVPLEPSSPGRFYRGLAR